MLTARSVAGASSGGCGRRSRRLSRMGASSASSSNMILQVMRSTLMMVVAILEMPQRSSLKMHESWSSRRSITTPWFMCFGSKPSELLLNFSPVCYLLFKVLFLFFLNVYGFVDKKSIAGLIFEGTCSLPLCSCTLYPQLLS
ncbi:hypothetical protein E2542_SST00384 [Spatholobus suberectus]|nr:hypothetical protein E2542_SST00384 [Spatholobus suberectus]